MFHFAPQTLHLWPLFIAAHMLKLYRCVVFVLKESRGGCTRALLPNYSALKLAELQIHKSDLDV